jgi:hypothetical protein
MRTPVLHAPFLARLWDYPTRPLTLIVPFAAGGTKATLPVAWLMSAFGGKADIRLIRRDVRL